MHVMALRSVILSAVLALWIIAAQATAQGTSGYLPEPISARQMTQYAQCLGMSPAQHQAADDFHLRYLHDFQELREGEIDELLKTQSVRLVMTRAFYHKRKLLEDQIGALDNALFDQMQTVLTDQQNAGMPRLRQARERERWMANKLLQHSPYTLCDLSRVFADLPPTDEELAACDPLLAQYESALTGALSRLPPAIDAMYREISDALV